MASIVPELQSLAPSAIIELFELQLVTELHQSSDVYRFHAGANQTIARGDIVWAGNRYQRFPVEITGFEYSGTQLPRPTLRVSNLFGVITSVLLNINRATPGNDLIGAKVTRIRTCARYLDAINFEGGVNPFGSPDPTAEAPREIYFVDRKVAENRDYIEFELAAAIDLANVKLPGRQCISSICQWEYRGPECGYTGANVFDENDNPGNLIAAPNFPAGTSTLSSGQYLNTNQFLISSNRWYKALMQDDGNFVVYSKANKAVWSTLTYGNSASVFRYQEDGNLVVYDATNRPTWNSYTQNQASITALTFAKLIPDNYPRGDQDVLQLIPATNFPAGTSSVTSVGSGFKLYPGESLTSANGWYQLLMQRDGNLVVYNKANQPVWFTGTGQPCFAWFQPDNNLVLYRYTDGAAIWNAGTYTTPTSSSAATNFSPVGTGIINAGNTAASKITSGNQIVSPNGWYRLKMQVDGNLVLYSKAQIFTGPNIENYNVAIWNSNTAGSGATVAHFQEDGNLVLYTSGGTAVWQSNKGTYPQWQGKTLQLQNDGNLVVYGTSTTVKTVAATNFPTGTGEIPCGTTAASKLEKGQVLYSKNGWYRLKMQTDGNLVLYSKGTSPTGPASEGYNVAVWSTGTYGTAAHYAYFQADGNLVLYDNTGVGGTGNPIWWSNKNEYTPNVGTKWQLQNDGSLALLNSSNVVVWRANIGTTVEPTRTVTDTTSKTPLWFTGTYNTTEPRSPVYGTATLALSGTGKLSITAGAVEKWSNGINITAEPLIETETGDNRTHGFFWEIFGSADSQIGQTKTVTRTFTIGNRTITFTFVGVANFVLPAGHYSGQTRSWTLTSETYVSSTGKWYLDEFLDLLITTSATNPFRSHPVGVLSPVGRQYRINGVLSSAGTLTMQDDGNLVQKDTSNNTIWSSNFSSNIEPKIPGDGSNFVDICGKRLSSCKVRFGDNADLPFGSFPGVGQYFV